MARHGRERHADKPAEREVETVEEESGAVIFYCMRGQYTFSLPEYERDEVGDIVLVNGKKKRLVNIDADGVKHAVEVSYKFERVPVRDPKTGKTSAIIHLGRFVVEENDPRREDLLAKLADARKTPINGILTEDEYKLQHNPEAFSFEKEKILLSGQLVELKDENEALRAKLAEAGITV
jgi:hypothetical protein